MEGVMKKVIVSAIVVLFIFLSSITIIKAENSGVKIAFVRHHDLWIKIDGKEKQITKGEYIIGPKWSHDGEWIAYVKGKKQNTLELYRLEDGKKLGHCNLKYQIINGHRKRIQLHLYLRIR